MAAIEKRKGWSTSGKLVTGNRVRQVSLQADFSAVNEQFGDNRQASTYVLEFGKGDNPATNLPIRSEALITWTVEGNSVSRRVSIANGISIQGAAQAVKVILTDVTSDFIDTLAPPIVPNGVEYDVSMQVTPGVRGSNSFPPFLVPPDAWFRTLGGAFPGVAIIPVPQNAGIISFVIEGQAFLGAIPAAIAAGALLIEMRQGAFPVANVAYDPSFKLIPISPGTDNIRISLNPAAQPGLTAVQYTVLFGVDG